MGTDIAVDPLRVALIDFESCKETLYAIRHRVFVLEQGVPESLERDPNDPRCIHALAHWNDAPVGTGRLTPDGRIGRMAVLAPYRGRSVGSAILARLLDAAAERGYREAVLAAQVTAVTFYERFGFRAEGVIFQEAGIDHLLMRKLLPRPGHA